jgi:4-diphosphocytidyl-2-C-methyl-D-erythritol kinase
MNYAARVSALAKINLTLRVLGKRRDGYHDLRTIFQSVALHDTLTIRRERGPFRLECGDPALPCDRTNLIWQAADAVWKASGRRGAPRDLVVAVVKRIPISAGLGGGSSDAAAALTAFARLWRLDRARLPALAAALGADVPYFLEGGTVLGLERGDLLFPLIDYPSRWVTLVIPGYRVNTEDAFEWYDRDTRARVVPRPVVRRPAGGAFHGGEPRNDLEGSVGRRHPDILRIVVGLCRAGAIDAAMTGSGSAVFGLFDSRALAARAAVEFARSTRHTLVTRTVGRDEYRVLAGK